MRAAGPLVMGCPSGRPSRHHQIAGRSRCLRYQTAPRKGAVAGVIPSGRVTTREDAWMIRSQALSLGGLATRVRVQFNG